MARIWSELQDPAFWVLTVVTGVIINLVSAALQGSLSEYFARKRAQRIAAEKSVGNSIFAIFLILLGIMIVLMGSGAIVMVCLALLHPGQGVKAWTIGLFMIFWGIFAAKLGAGRLDAGIQYFLGVRR